MLVYSIIIILLGIGLFKYSPEILDREKEDANNFLRRFLAKYTTVFILRILSLFLIFVGLFGIISFIYKIAN